MKPEPTEKEVVEALEHFKADATRLEVSTEIVVEYGRIVNEYPTKVSVDVLHKHPGHLIYQLNLLGIQFRNQKFMLHYAKRVYFETVLLIFLEDKRNAN